MDKSVSVWRVFDLIKFEIGLFFPQFVQNGLDVSLCYQIFNSLKRSPMLSIAQFLVGLRATLLREDKLIIIFHILLAHLKFIILLLIITICKEFKLRAFLIAFILKLHLAPLLIHQKSIELKPSILSFFLFFFAPNWALFFQVIFRPTVFASNQVH